MKNTNDKIITIITEAPIITISLSTSEYFRHKEILIEFKNGDILEIDTKNPSFNSEMYTAECFTKYFGWKPSEATKLSDENNSIYKKLIANLAKVNLMSDIKEIYIMDL